MNVARSLPSLCAGLRHISLTGSLELASKTPIKRPNNAYFLYRDANYKALSKANPTLSMLALTAKLGEQWRNLPHSQKVTYEKAADAEREQYKREMEKLSESELDAMREEARSKRLAKRLKQVKSELRAVKFDAPSRPGGALALYLSETFDKRSPGTAAEKMKRIAEAFKRLDPVQKAVYESRAKSAGEAYEVKKKDWLNTIKIDGRNEKIQALNAELNSIRKQIN